MHLSTLNVKVPQYPSFATANAAIAKPLRNKLTENSCTQKNLQNGRRCKSAGTTMRMVEDQAVECQKSFLPAAYIPPVDSDEDVDVKGLIASLESSSTATYQPVPEDLRMFINKLCSKHSVEDSIWTQSPTNSKLICIRGKGVDKIRKELEEEFPSFQFKIEESGSLHTKHMCGDSKDVVEWHRGIDGPSDAAWKRASSSCCQLLVLGKWFQGWSLYAVVPASFLLDGEQCEQMAVNGSMELMHQAREAVRAREGVVHHTLEISRLGQYRLATPAMIAYRLYYTNINTSTDDPEWRCWAGKCKVDEKCPHMYMNDIAVLRVEELPRNLPISRGCRAVKFDRIVEFNMTHITEMIKKAKKVFINVVALNTGVVHEVQGRLVPGGEPGRGKESSTRTYADHVTFFIDSQSQRHDQNLPVQRGMILFVKDTRRQLETRHAFAMVIGRNLSFVDVLYQAVLLKPALRDIEMAYPNIADSFRNSRLPPCGYLAPINQALAAPPL